MTFKDSKKRPGPPKSFDVDTALHAAMIVFWQKGFDGASLSDLTEAMGINRPSLYSTFGDKQALYLRALNWYDEQGELGFIRSTREKNAQSFVKKLLYEIADLYAKPDLPAGCFLIQSALSTSSATGFARKETSRRRRRNKTALQSYLKTFPVQQLPSQLTPEQLADYITAIGNALAVRAADGAKRTDLYQIIELALSFWPAITAPTQTQSRAARPTQSR